MNINVVQTIIAIAVSALIAFGLYTVSDVLRGAGSFLFLAVALVLAVGVSFEQSRATTNIRVVSGIFFAVALLSNMIFSFVSFSVTSYVIFHGIIFLIYFLLVYSINNAKQ